MLDLPKMRTDFASAAEQRAHYAAIKQRFYPAPVPQKPVEISAPLETLQEVPVTYEEKPEPQPKPVLERVAEIEIARPRYIPLRPHPVDVILEATSRHFHFTRVQLASKRRSAKLVFPRQIAFYIAAKKTASSLPEIGRRFGGFDHTTVLHSRNKIEKLLEGGDPWVIANMEAVEQLADQLCPPSDAEYIGGVG